MAKRHYLRFLIRNMDDLIFEISQEDAERLQMITASFKPGHSNGFFSFDSLDGLSIALNLTYVQAISYLCDRSDKPSDKVESYGNIKICLRDRVELIETNTDTTEELYDFFNNLEYGPEVIPFPSFMDDDGELYLFNASEIVWATAPTDLIEEGEQIALVNDGLIQQ